MTARSWREVRAEALAREPWLGTSEAAEQRARIRADNSEVRRWRGSGHLERAIETAGGREEFDAAVDQWASLGFGDEDADALRAFDQSFGA